MNKILVLLIVIFTYFIFATSVLALEDGEESTESAKPKDTFAQKVEEYTLPYPGLLPDNPLYILKTTRDRFISIVISDPLKKAAFNLLQADKRLQAGVALIDKKKFDLAESTLSKGVNYFEEAIDQAKVARKEGMDTKGIDQKLITALKKHEVVLKLLQDKLNNDEDSKIKLLENRLKDLEKKVNN